MMSNIEYKIDNDKSFVRYIYGDIRDELKNLWKTMLTLLGMLGVALGYLFKGTEGLISFWQYLIAAQLLWLFAMIEILLFSNYISKHKFLMMIERNFEPKIEERPDKVPFWQNWVCEDSFSSYNGYTIPVLCITAWSFIAYFLAAYYAFLETLCAKNDFMIPLVVVIIVIEFLAALLASYKTLKAYNDACNAKAEDSKKQSGAEVE